MTALQAEFDAWRTRDLSALQVVYLFLYAQFHAARSRTTEKEGILAAYALLEDGRAVLLHLGLGPLESADAWVAFLHDLTARGLGEPLLIILDGCHGLRSGNLLTLRDIQIGVHSDPTVSRFPGSETKNAHPLLILLSPETRALLWQR